jgi:2-polyprenyl-3-methyl-5-hydroxy-6-metoxy-1,4-benzoquinol methylase
VSDRQHPGARAELTTKGHWDEAWAVPPRWRLPSPLIVGTRNMQRILRPEVRAGMRVLEIGCAPGNILGWVDAARGAEVSGPDLLQPFDIRRVCLLLVPDIKRHSEPPC